MASSSSSNPAPAVAGPSTARPAHYDEERAIEQDIIDPDDLSLNDLDDPLDAPTNTTTTSALLTSALGGRDTTAVSTSTLDESVWDTLRRDLVSTGQKLQLILYPRFLVARRWPADAATLTQEGGYNALALSDWDLWGPLLFSLLLATLLALAVPAGPKRSNTFAGVFTMVWAGEAAVTLQIKLLGGRVAFMQAVSVIGYTLFPMALAALLSMLRVWVVVRVVVDVLLWAWALASGVSILGGSGVVPGRVGLAVFPLGLFYASLVVLCLFS